MKAVKFPSHRHPLNPIELLPREDDEHKEDGKDEDGQSRVCGFCGKMVKGSGYGCSQCNFTAHLGCAKNPPSLVIGKSKIHEHPLTLLPKQVSFTCNACGLSGDKSPYVCLACSFIIHTDCIDFPRVISIIRHGHRLSHTWFLGLGKWNCGVCRQKIDGKHGAYNCLRCEDYAVHLRCALREDVWDGLDLELVPEEYIGEEETPFALIGDDNKLIKHVSHEHFLKLVNEDGDDVIQPEKVRCSGCAFPMASDPFYKCMQCDFVLHKKCTNLPLKTTTFLHRHPLTLCTNEAPRNLSQCQACHLPFNGFRYRCLNSRCKDDIEFDVRCCSVTEPLLHLLHPHPLYFNLTETGSICSVCDLARRRCVLGCIICDFKLCTACVTLPAEVVYKYDEHLLSLTIGEDVNPHPDWCDICEHKIDGKITHYKCSDCGPVLHTECALGSLRNIRPGSCFITPDGDHEVQDEVIKDEYEVILKDQTSQLLCNQCGNDCNEPLLLMSTTTTTDVAIYLCSFSCFLRKQNWLFVNVEKFYSYII